MELMTVLFATFGTFFIGYFIGNMREGKEVGK